jgi:L,D-peptidoglycan transpeptidase YkuD (ErfK/YbiS/YcfS/YnhG family)
MKQAITVRIDPELLAMARVCAKQENRTLTNFLETALKQRVGSAGASPMSKHRNSARTGSKGSVNAKS